MNGGNRMQSFFSKKRGALAIGFTIGLSIMGIFILFLLFGRQNTLSVDSSEEIPTDVTVEQVVLADNEFVKFQLHPYIRMNTY